MIKKKTADINDKVKYVSDHRGEVVAVQISIGYFQQLIESSENSKHEETMESAIKEIYEIEQGKQPKVTLSKFIDEI
jgi:hypothetical protein